MIDYYQQITLFILFLILSGFFSSTETAFTAVNRIRLKQSLDGKNEDQSRLLETLMTKPTRLITAILIGNNFSNVACSALATTLLLEFFRQKEITNLAITMPIITVVVTILLLIFGEITPKTFALKQPERFAIFSSRFLNPFMILLTPVINVFDLFHRLIQRLFGIAESDSRQTMSLDELKLMVDIGYDDGVIEDDKNRMLTSIFEFSDIIVREIMTPRTDTICMSVSETVSFAIQLIVKHGHSRIPVFEDKMDNVVGFAYAKDLLNVPKNEMDNSIRKFMRNPEFIPEYKPVDELLQQMKRSKLHIAIVVDEHGGMSGIITMEDIVEEIVGEIRDEYDTDDDTEFKKLSSDVYDVDAKMNIRDLEELLDIQLSVNFVSKQKIVKQSTLL